MNNDMKMAQTVMLVDAPFLDWVVTELKNNFEQRLGRALKEADLSDLLVYLALDAGVQPGDNQIQVFFIYDEPFSRFAHCLPASLEKELNNVAFQDALGEFSCFSFQPEKIASHEELYVESLQLVADAEEVKKLVVVSYNEEYGRKVSEILDKANGKEIIQFRMDEPQTPVSYRWEILAYPIMQALGIRGDEL